MAVQNTENGIVWGTQGHQQYHHSSAYDFLFDFNRNHASILYHFRDIAGYQSKVADFDPPHLDSAPSQGVTPVEFRGDLWHQKNQSPCAIVRCCLCDPLFSRFSRTPTCDGQTDRQTDRRTDRRTQGHGQYRGCIASRGKKEDLQARNMDMRAASEVTQDREKWRRTVQPHCQQT